MRSKIVVPIIIVTLIVAGLLAFFLNHVTLDTTVPESASEDASAAGGTMPEGSPMPEDGGLIGGDAVNPEAVTPSTGA